MSTHIKDKTVYRIYTEDVNREETIKLVGEYFSNFSVFYGACYWHGKKESTVVFEIIDDGQCNITTTDIQEMSNRVQNVSQAIRRANNQTDVLVIEDVVNISFIN